ncbi:hypothetical protein GW915_11105 [bacterium]|nr:hypothetical protein [bacterium]
MLVGGSKKFKRALSVSLVGFVLVSCSTDGGRLWNADLGPEPLPWAGEGNEILEAHYAIGASQGVMLLFKDSHKGIGVGGLAWGRPVEKYNPGVDCRLVREKLGPPNTMFKCSVPGPDRNYVAVEIFEDLRTPSRKMNKIKLSSDSKKSYSRWSQELRINNYRTLRKAGDKAMILLSSDNKTRATLRMNRREVELIFEPNGPY